MINKLKEIRKDRGITQTEMVMKTGISQGEISDIENGKIKPGIERSLTIASALGVAVEEIWQLEEAAR